MLRLLRALAVIVGQAASILEAGRVVAGPKQAGTAFEANREAWAEAW